MRASLVALMVALGLAGFVSVAYGLGSGDTPSDRKYQDFLPGIAAGDGVPTPTPTSIPTPTPHPPVYDGKIASLALASGGISPSSPIQELDTRYDAGKGQDVFQDPTAPGNIATYPRFGKPGNAGGNTIFAAHVDYYTGAAVPFARIRSTQVGDALYLTMDNGLVYTYTVKSVDTVSAATLDSGGMEAVVFPPLDSYTERVTLISCTGDFIPAAIGGEYASRLIVTAERYVP